MWRFLENLWKKPPRKVGLALSGGGARGLAHIGVLKILEQEGVPIDRLAGTSMGGVIAAGYAAGLEPEFMEQEALRMGNLRRLLALADRTFDDLRLPLALVAVDLNTGQEVYLTQGQVVDAVRATTALPGVFRPVEWDGQLLVDGGLLDNLPADAARHMGADVVIAVDVSSDDRVVSHLTQALHRYRYVSNGLVDTVEVLWRSLGVMMAEIGRRRLAEAHPEVIIRPAIPPDVTVLTGFPRAAEIIAAGEEAAIEALPHVRALLTSPA